LSSFCITRHFKIKLSFYDEKPSSKILTKANAYLC
uniref:Uncharacterized protein n=1 Tax=Parascaris univalens TaxID=6257 RepID=A0A915C9W1_PARUN